MKFVSYYRVSTSSQGQSGLGLEAQAKCIQDYVARNDGVVLKEFTEIESGKCATRVELGRAIRYCKLTKSKLIISKVCRLTRDVHFLTGLQKSGVDFVCCDMPDANTMTVQLMTVLAEGEAQNISVRTKEALAAAKARGGQARKPKSSFS
jgi:DNA invertase Pin-like site-specific DNA recombinase